MLRFLRLVFALFFSQLLLFVLALFVLGGLFGGGSAPGISSGSMLHLGLAGEIIEYPTLPPVPFVRERPLSQHALLESLEAAATDERIGSVLVELQDPGLGWGKAMELHQALLRFRESGKPVVAFAPSLGEIDLLIATACDSIYMPATGRLYLNGIAVGPMYFKGTLDKLAIRPNTSRIGAYKDAVEPSLRNDMSEASREQYEWLLDDLWGEFLETVTSRRNLGRADLEDALSRGVLQPEEAVELGLVDGVLYRDEIVRRYVDDPGKDPLVPVMEYHRDARSHLGGSGRAIAVVHTRGLILRGGHDYAPGFGAILGAAEAVRDLEDAADDDGIAAVVLRIDSPGGEIVASDIIRDGVERVRQRKPIIVSMVDVAASGGYMMAFPASRILALPTTITGSIGSFTEKFNLRGLYNKFGATRDFVTRGSYPFLFSDYHDWSAAEESLIARQQWADYDRWIGAIASKRSLTPEMVDSIGRGRVWTGQQAVEHGLVDELGGLDRAVQVAKELSSLAANAKPPLVHYPEERSFFDLLLEQSDALWAGVMERWSRAPRLPRGVAWSVLDLDLRQ